MATHHHSFLQIPSTLLLCLFIATTSLLPHPSHANNVSRSVKRATCVIHMDELHFGPDYRAASADLAGRRSGSLDHRGARYNVVTSVDHNGTAAHGSARSPSNENSHKASRFNATVGRSSVVVACPQVSKMVDLLKKVHPKWSPAAIKSAIVTTARAMDRDLDDHRGRGRVVVDLRRAMDPGLVYDINSKEHVVNFVCSLNHTKNRNLTTINQLMSGRVDNCSRRGSRDLNHPSFIVSYDNKKASSRVMVQRFRRTVRNVGEAGAVYKVDVVAPRGCSVSVHPKTLVFAKKNEKKMYTLTLMYVKNMKENISQGWISWNEVLHGQHKVRSPIVIAPLGNGHAV